MSKAKKVQEIFYCLIRRDAVCAYLERRALSKRVWKDGDLVRVSITRQPKPKKWE